MKLILWTFALHCLCLSSAQGILPNPTTNLNEDQLIFRDGSFVGDSINVKASMQTGQPGLAVEPLTSQVEAQQRNYQTGGNVNLDGQFVEPYNIEFKYHDYDKMTKFLRQTTARYPSLTALYSIGKSVQGNLHRYIFNFHLINH